MEGIQFVIIAVSFGMVFVAENIFQGMFSRMGYEPLSALLYSLPFATCSGLVYYLLSWRYAKNREVKA